MRIVWRQSDTVKVSSALDAILKASSAPSPDHRQPSSRLHRSGLDRPVRDGSVSSPRVTPVRKNREVGGRAIRLSFEARAGSPSRDARSPRFSTIQASPTPSTTPR